MTQVLTYQGKEMEEDEETMRDYDIQVAKKHICAMLIIFYKMLSQDLFLFRTGQPFSSRPSWPVASSLTPTGSKIFCPRFSL